MCLVLLESTVSSHFLYLYLCMSVSIDISISHIKKPHRRAGQRYFRRPLKAAADAGLICSLQQEGVPANKTLYIHCAELCRRADSYSDADRAVSVNGRLGSARLGSGRASFGVRLPAGSTAGGKASEEAGVQDMEAEASLQGE